MAKAYRWTLPDGYYAGEVEDYGLLPANGTHTAPDILLGLVPRWTGKKWEQVEDHRGKEGYLDGQPHSIKECGPLPEGWTAEKPLPPPPTLEEAKTAAVQAVKDASYKTEIAGITIQGMQIPTDRESQSMITGAVVGTMLDPAKVTRWQTAATQDGVPVFIDLSAQQLQAIGMAVRGYVQACFDARDAKCAAIVALQTPDAVTDWLISDLNEGWPA